MVWVTNNPEFRSFVKNVLFPKWGCMYIGTWFWLKVRILNNNNNNNNDNNNNNTPNSWHNLN